LNFDCKLRLRSSGPADLLHGHVRGIDHMAINLKMAAAILENDFIADKISQRYQGWGQKFGQSILNGRHNLVSIASHTVNNNFNLNMSVVSKS
jgi:xylose isomerase